MSGKFTHKAALCAVSRCIVAVVLFTVRLGQVSSSHIGLKKKGDLKFPMRENLTICHTPASESLDVTNYISHAYDKRLEKGGQPTRCYIIQYSVLDLTVRQSLIFFFQVKLDSRMLRQVSIAHFSHRTKVTKSCGLHDERWKDTKQYLWADAFHVLGLQTKTQNLDFSRSANG